MARLCYIQCGQTIHNLYTMPRHVHCSNTNIVITARLKHKFLLAHIHVDNTPHHTHDRTLTLKKPPNHPKQPVPQQTRSQATSPTLASLLTTAGSQKGVWSHSLGAKRGYRRQGPQIGARETGRTVVASSRDGNPPARSCARPSATSLLISSLVAWLGFFVLLGPLLVLLRLDVHDMAR